MQNRISKGDFNYNPTVSALKSESDITTRLVNALEKVIRSAHDSAITQSNMQFLNRMATAKRLHWFSGNPFKDAIRCLFGSR